MKYYHICLTIGRHKSGIDDLKNIHSDIFIEFSDYCSKDLEDNNIFLDMSDYSKYLRRRVNKKKIIKDKHIWRKYK